MGNGILTPFGEIQIIIDNVRSDYEFEPYRCSVRSVQDRPLAGSYQITVFKKDWETVQCVLVPSIEGVANIGASGERYLYAEFAVDNMVLTIGAEDDNAAFITNRLRYGVAYVRTQPIHEVTFRVAWATDYEGQFDIRTQLATDNY